MLTSSVCLYELKWSPSRKTSKLIRQIFWKLAKRNLIKLKTLMKLIPIKLVMIPCSFIFLHQDFTLCIQNVCLSCLSIFMFVNSKKFFCYVHERAIASEKKFMACMLLFYAIHFMTLKHCKHAEEQHHAVQKVFYIFLTKFCGIRNFIYAARIV